MGQIIEFSAAARPARNYKPAAAEGTAIGNSVPLGRRLREAKPELPPAATETAKNSRLRSARRDAWWEAIHVTGYWGARLDWHRELDFAQRHGIGDSASFPSADERFDLVGIGKWREAVVKQLLTPAPDGGAVAWKRAKLQRSDFAYLPVKREWVESAIAADVAFLAAHPTRKAKQS
jgi:hypothetical protein